MIFQDPFAQRLWRVQTLCLFAVSEVMGVAGQLFLKRGVVQLGLFKFDTVTLFFSQFFSAFSNWWVLLGFVFCFISSLFWLILLTKFDLSFAYPILSIGYIFILFSAAFIFHEPVSVTRWLGVLVIISGIAIISRS